MKAFRFTLEAVHTIRQRQEQQALEIYVQALQGRQQVLDRLETIQNQIWGNQQEISRLLARSCTASAVAQVNQYARGLEKLHAEQIAALALAERKINVAFQAMVAARQQSKMVENFRAKQHHRHRQAERREEQKFLDDLASCRVRPHPAWHDAEPVA